MKKNNFLLGIVIPYYEVQAQKDDHFILYNTNGEIILAAHLVLKHLEFNENNDIKGKTLLQLNHGTPKMVELINQLFTSVIKTKQTIKFLTIGGQKEPPFKNHHELVLQKFEPIIDDKNKVVAILACKLPLLESNLINLLLTDLKSKSKLDNKIIETLSSREFEILYLLSHGISQYQIAKILGITRSTVAKIISDRIYNKFSLNNPNSEKLIALAIQHGFNSKVPKTLVEEQILIIP